MIAKTRLYDDSNVIHLNRNCYRWLASLNRQVLCGSRAGGS
jgi:hypothetical protein